MVKPEILYEDRDLVVVKKPAGTDSQESRGSGQDMVSILKNYRISTELSTQGGGKEGVPYIAVVHRLDRQVSGVMVYAKTKAAAAHLSKQVQDQWIRFAETGDPGTEALPWPAFDSENRWTMILKDHSEAVKDPLSAQRTVLNPILDYRLNASCADMRLNVPFAWKAAAKVLGLILLILVLLLLLK